MTTLEERVARLEAEMQEVRHGVLAGQAAHSHALELLHTTLARFEEDTGASLGDLRASVGSLGSDVADMKTDMSEVKATLRQLLDRL